MVATAAMQEADRGRWILRTTLGEVLPGLVPEHEDIILEQLLGHRSGLPDHVSRARGDALPVEALRASCRVGMASHVWGASRHARSG
ncbi:MAG: serine hydrolase [Dermatophilaceae bacterium]